MALRFRQSMMVVRLVMMIALARVTSGVGFPRSALGAAAKPALGAAAKPALGAALGAKPATAEWLERRLEMSEEETKRFVAAAQPRLLCRDPRTLEVRIRYLESLGLRTAEARRVICSLPSVLNCNVETNLRPTIEFLERRLGLDREALVGILVSFPQVLGYSVRENLDPKITYLSRRLALTPVELGAVVHKYPSMLGYSLTRNIGPTLDFYARALSLEPAELGGFVSRFPSALGRSLDKRLRPRYEKLLARGLDVDRTRMSYIMTRTDAKFDAWLARASAPLEGAGRPGGRRDTRHGGV